jgi:redox-sensitive bicupin YhaK (pirin superfamily)
MVQRYLPNRYTRIVGPFFFLDHLLPTIIGPHQAEIPNRKNAHPHRGIATFTYLFSGEMEHFDSMGHKGTVGPGGAQWMKAGNGIIHDEHQSKKFQEEGGLLHGLQFWINLPAINKAESPQYLAVQNDDFPIQELPDNDGSLKILIGEYETLNSPVQTYSRQFNYHLKLNPKATFTLNVHPDFEAAVFLVSGPAEINGSLHDQELLVFGIENSEIKITNPGDAFADIIIFGGEAYKEPIIAEGPFVMNSNLEIAEAYRDYSNGKYGKIDYKR